MSFNKMSLFESKKNRNKNKERKTISSTVCNSYSNTQSFIRSTVENKAKSSTSNGNLFEIESKLRHKKNNLDLFQKKIETNKNELARINANNYQKKSGSIKNFSKIELINISNESEISSRKYLSSSIHISNTIKSDFPIKSNSRKNLKNSMFSKEFNPKYQFQNSKQVRYPNNPYNEITEKFKRIINSGIKQSSYFLNKEVLNFDKINDKFSLEKILKINSFCEDIESMEMDIKTFKNTNTNKSSLFSKPSEFLSIHDSEKMNSVLDVASQRRISVYKNLFENIQAILKEIVLITNLKNNSETPNLPQNMHINDDPDRSIKNQQEYEKENPQLQNNVNNVISDQNNNENNNNVEFYDISSNSISENMSSEFSEIENSFTNLSEGEFNIYFPISMINNVKTASKKNIPTVKSRNGNQHKDDLAQQTKFCSKTKVFMFSKQFKGEKFLDRYDTTERVGEYFVPFQKARDELAFYNKNVDFDKSNQLCNQL